MPTGSPDPATEIGRNIAAERVRAGLRQSDLGKAIGKDASRISRWEQGLAEPRVSELRAIALALGCGLERLLPREVVR